jgi:seryl-tRNA synthetase
MPGEAHQVRDDTSLQGWGRRLKVMAGFLEELEPRQQAAAQEMAEAAEITRRFASHGTENLPADARLAAEVESVADRMRALAAEQEQLTARRRQILADAQALHGQYQVAHETDEARLAGERGGVARERMADVTVAQQDT